MSKTNIKILIGLLLISNLIFVYLYTSEMNFFKKDEYSYVNKADTLAFGDVLKYRFENLKLFKTNRKEHIPMLYNKDTNSIRKYINEHNLQSDSFQIIERFLEIGDAYYSNYIIKNYNKLPDTIWADGYILTDIKRMEVMDCGPGKYIKILSYKYKK